MENFTTTVHVCLSSTVPTLLRFLANVLDRAIYKPKGQVVDRNGYGLKGGHGWDDTSPDPDGYTEGPMPDMRTVFFARGPSIKKDQRIDWIKMVDVYQVFTYLLGVKAEPHNGTWSRVQGLFTGKVGIPTQISILIQLDLTLTILFISSKCIVNLRLLLTSQSLPASLGKICKLKRSTPELTLFSISIKPLATVPLAFSLRPPSVTQKL